ncbi:TIGR04255 family protein [Hoeflea sp. G2-23]|uniref:TIGR04255 family protein n=1 Tax=Hoeflea algicola TaxID=2983763 RepID=A0ABT3ZDK1_9HYPH|nr:TIGR04255 family protein [Hoeflea algicola]MCY0149852.1 TIGR04255 family protein [Hoeflea algicola]
MKYEAPPIVEVTVEFRFSEPVPYEIIEKKAHIFENNYEGKKFEQQARIELKSSPEQTVHADRRMVGIRFSSNNELEVCIIHTNRIVVAQLAPYNGWEDFSPRIARDLSLFSKHFVKRKFSRIGLRSVNRIDIPEQTVELSDYLTLYPHLPFYGKTMGTGFALESTQQFLDTDYLFKVRSATVESPVPESLSFLLDIDLSTEQNIPMRENEILAKLDEMRGIKNHIFETSITDKCRTLFN